MFCCKDTLFLFCQSGLLSFFSGLLSFFSVKTAEKLKNMAIECSSAVFFRSYIFPPRNFAKDYL